MKRKLKLFISFIVILTSCFAFPNTQAYAKKLSLPSPHKHTAYCSKITKDEVTKKVFVRDEYSDWIKLGSVGSYGGVQGGNHAEFKKEERRTLETSIDATFKNINLGAKFTYSISATMFGDVSRPLNPFEYTSFYYRKHYKVYETTVTRTTYCNSSIDRGVLSTTKIIGYVREIQPMSSSDKGWMYSYFESSLKNTLNKNYRICNTIDYCIVKK